MRTAQADIGSLVDRINRGELRLPEMQRAYVWKPAQVAGLVDSLYKRYPSGSLLLWEADESVLERTVAISGPNQAPLVKPQYLLDGQQRLTSLHRVFSGHERALVVFNVESEKFQIESAATRKDARWIRVHDLLSGASDTFSLVEALKERLPGLEARLISARLERIKKISDYLYYLEILDKLPYEEVTEIFVRVNSKGRALRDTDLALATLSARWPGVVGRFEEVAASYAAMGFRDLDFTFLTRCLAATATDTASPKSFTTIEDERLEIGWMAVKRGLNHLIKLLQGSLLVDTSGVLPSVNALVPLVAYLGLRDDRALELDERNALLYWLLGAWTQARFSGSSQTVISQDVAAVRSDDPVRNLYRNLGLLGQRLVVTEEMLAGRSSRSPYFFLSYLVARAAKANDWWYAVPVSARHEGTYKIEYHHIHPRATLKSAYSKAEINDLANLAFISAKANRTISSRSPSVYFAELNSDDMRNHCVPADALLRTADAYPNFVSARRSLLAKAMTALLETYRPSFLAEDAAAAPDPAIGEHLTIDTYGTDRTADDTIVVLTARRGTLEWRDSLSLSSLQQALEDVFDGRGSELHLGREDVQIEQGADQIDIPMGPLLVSGTVEEWRNMLNRELDDLLPLDELPHVDEPPLWEGERLPFPVLDSE